MSNKKLSNEELNPALNKGAVIGCSIQFKKKFSMMNGNKVTKKNWHKVIAVSNRPCKNVLGFPAIEEAKKNGGEYFEKWRLVYEKEKTYPDGKKSTFGYIFREINHGGGINGHHKTPKEAIWWACSNHITVWLEE